MDDFELEIKTGFIDEALLNLEEAEGAFMELESSSDRKSLLDQIFRVAHNLKGGSRAVGFGDISEFTHILENLVQKLQKDQIQLTSEIVTILLKCNDRLIEMLNGLKADLNAKFDNADLLAVLNATLSGSADPSAPSVIVTEAPPASIEIPSAAPATAAVNETVQAVATEDLTAPAPESSALSGLPSADAFFATEPQVEPALASSPAPVKAPAESAPSKAVANPSKSQDNEVVRVNIGRIDLLNDYVGELIVLQSMIQQQAGHETNTQLQASIRQMTKLSKDIQGLSMSLRMLPVKPMVQKLQRVVRDTSAALGKSVRFDVIGEQLDIDKSVLDRLSDPLIHILRNAVDHGLEKPEDRSKSGKNPEGRVSLSFSNEGNHLVVEITDDGKGINSEVLRKKAIDKKIISANQTYTEKQLINLIFHAGFSTKTEASEISGRGVGMDVVKTNVEKAGGSVEISTQVGKGSLFRLQIPLSLAVIEGMIVTSSKNRYVIPLSQIQETINLKNFKVHQGKNGVGDCFELRGYVVPIFDIESTLTKKAGTAQIDPDDTAIVVNIRDQLAAISVKDILRAQQIVIKPLGSGIPTQKGWIGTCVLGDGMPTLIVSPVDILESKIVLSQNNTPAEKTA